MQAELSRWMVEATIRFIRQSDHLGDLRILDCDRLRNRVPMVLLLAYFTAMWRRESPNRSMLPTQAATMAKRVFELPDFHVLRNRGRSECLAPIAGRL